jgi:hypothetical protein
MPQSLWDRLNQRRAELRDTVAYAINNPGEGPPDDPGAHGIHSAYAGSLTDKLGQALPASVAGGVVDAAGIGNEGLSGILTWLAGQGFMGPKGFDSEDIAANREGIAPSVERLQASGDPGAQTINTIRTMGQPGSSQIASLIQALSEVANRNQSRQDPRVAALMSGLMGK